jgi:hypothetical protein
MSERKSYLGLILMGSLVGLNETLVGSLSMHHYRSVVLSSITLLLLVLARLLYPKTGTSLVITAIALVFKMTNLGVMLCKPAALLALGVSFEVFASLVIAKNSFSYFRYALTPALAALAAFALFAGLETFIVKNPYWQMSRFTNYIIINGSLTALCSGLLSMAVLASAKKLESQARLLADRSPTLVQGTIGCLAIAAWIAGSIAR